MSGVRIPALHTHWLSKEKVYKIVGVSSATDEIILEDVHTKKKYKERFATFRYAYQQVFKVGEVAGWLNKSPRSIYRYEAQGLILKQKTYPVGGNRELRYYTLDDVFRMHEMISQLHQGRPRRDGRIVNNTMPDLGTLKIMLLERYKL